jgi:hypothetical protein
MVAIRVPPRKVKLVVAEPVPQATLVSLVI